jgi:uncharacterized protein (DUF1697 family)
VLAGSVYQEIAKSMRTYIAFLRGINVGGNNIIKMDALRQAFMDMGFTEVATYIQSGNVVFVSNKTNCIRIEKQIERVLSTRFGYLARVLVREKKEMEATVAHLPKIFSSKTWKHNVIFLSNKIDSPTIVKKFQIKKDIEQVRYYKGVLFWSARLTGLTRSTMIKLARFSEYKEMTVRNVNTIKKIAEMMSR